MFEVGKEVICIKTHDEGVFKKGDEFLLLGIRKSCCGIELDVGKEKYSHTDFIHCIECDSIRSLNGSVWWFSSSRFAPKSEITEIEALYIENEIAELLNVKMEDLI